DSLLSTQPGAPPGNLGRLHRTNQAQPATGKGERASSIAREMGNRITSKILRHGEGVQLTVGNAAAGGRIPPRDGWQAALRNSLCAVIRPQHIGPIEDRPPDSIGRGGFSIAISWDARKNALSAASLAGCGIGRRMSTNCG